MMLSRKIRLSHLLALLAGVLSRMNDRPKQSIDLKVFLNVISTYLHKYLPTLKLIDEAERILK